MKALIDFQKNPKSRIFLLFLILLTLIFKLSFFLQIDIIPDEAYYWLWSKNLDFSYYDQGPGIAFLIYFFTHIFSNLFFSIKFGAFILYTLAIFFMFLTSRELKISLEKSLLLCLLLLNITGFFIGSFFLLHDSGLVFFWSLSIYLTIRYLQRKETITIYFLFISVAFGILTKHTMLFFLMSMFIYVIFSKERKLYFTNKHFYFAFCFLLIFVSPIFYWNWKNNFSGIEAIFYLRSSFSTNTKNGTILPYFLGQIFSFNLFFWIVIFIFSFLRKKREELEKFIFINAFILPVFFFFFSFQKSVQPNWPYPSYLSLILLLIYLFPKNSKKIFVYKTLIIVGFLFSCLTNFSLLYATEVAQIFKINVSPYNSLKYRYKGYKEITQEILKVQEKFPNAKIATNKYQDSSILSFYLPNHSYVPSINILQKNQYDYWQQLQKNQDYLIVHIQENVCEKSFIFFKPILKYMFEEIQEFEEKEIKIDNLIVKRYQIWYVKNYKRNWMGAYKYFFTDDLIEIIVPGVNLENKIRPFQISRNLFLDYIFRKGNYDCKKF